MTSYKMLATGCILLAWSVAAHAQDQSPVAPVVAASGDPNSIQDTESERWNLYYQATSIGDYHGAFTAPYTGAAKLAKLT